MLIKQSCVGKHAGTPKSLFKFIIVHRLASEKERELISVLANKCVSNEAILS